MQSSAASIRLAEQYDFIYAVVGVHPSETTDMTEADMEQLRRMAAHPKVVAIGEIGLDYHYEGTKRELQRKWFRRQLELAKELDMPVVIHDRESKGEAVGILKEMEISKGVMHCFPAARRPRRNYSKWGFTFPLPGC